MGYCHTHGSYSGDSGCWDCQKAEERASEAAAELTKQLEQTREDARENAERAEEAARERADQAEETAWERAHLVNNPGDYQCPYCLMTSLKKPARRCPRCQHDIESGYWDRVNAREAEAGRREVEARRREEAEKERQKKAREKWLKSPEGIAATKAEAAAHQARKAAEAKVAEEARQAQLAAVLAKEKSARARTLAPIAMWLCIAAFPALILEPVAGILLFAGALCGIMSLLEFLHGSKDRNERAGMGKAIGVVVFVVIIFGRVIYVALFGGA